MNTKTIPNLTADTVTTAPTSIYTPRQVRDVREHVARLAAAVAIRNRLRVLATDNSTTEEHAAALSRAHAQSCRRVDDLRGVRS